MEYTECGYVYKYVEKSTGIVMYVGMVNPGGKLERRIKEHTRDTWYIGRSFDIYYLELETKLACETYESEFIHYYKSYSYGNKAKSDWGKSGLIDDHESIEWKKVEDEIEISQSVNEEIRSKLIALEKQYVNIENEIDKVMQDIQDKTQDLEKLELTLDSVQSATEYITTAACDGKVCDEGFKVDEVCVIYKLLGNKDVFFKSSLYDLAGNSHYNYELRLQSDGYLYLLFEDGNKVAIEKIFSVDGCKDNLANSIYSMIADHGVYYPSINLKKFYNDMVNNWVLEKNEVGLEKNVRRDENKIVKNVLKKILLSEKNIVVQ